MNEASAVDVFVIPHERRTEVLEDIARSYLLELSHALEQAKIARMMGVTRENETPTSLMVKEGELQSRVDVLTRKLKDIDAL